MLRNVCLRALVLAPLCLVLAACSGSVSATSTPTTTARTSATATAKATATKVAATSTTAPTGSPRLGGPGAAFISQYGPLTSQSDQASGDLHFREYPGVALDFLIVDLGVRFGITPGDQAAASITVASPPSQPWTPDVAHATCAVFFPSDAHEVKQVASTLQGAVIGQDVIYQSATLATTFPASAFQDVNQNPTTPGAFDVLYLYAASDGSTIDSCDLELGTQQAQ